MTEDKKTQFKSRKQAYIQEEILLSAVALFAQRGYRAVSLGDVAANLGYTKSVIYYYFKSKSEMLARIFDQCYDLYLNGIADIVKMSLDPREKLKRAITQHALNVMDRPDWNAIYWREENELSEEYQKLILAKKHEYDSIVESIYTEGVKKKQFEKLPAGVAVKAILGMCNSVHIWYKPTGALSPKEIADHIAHIIMKGVALP